MLENFCHRCNFTSKIIGLVSELVWCLVTEVCEVRELTIKVPAAPNNPMQDCTIFEELAEIVIKDYIIYEDQSLQKVTQKLTDKFA